MNKKITFTRGINFVTLTVETGNIYDIKFAVETGKVSYAVNCTPSPLLPKIPSTKQLWQAFEKIEPEFLAIAKESFGSKKEQDLFWKINAKLEAINRNLK